MSSDRQSGVRSSETEMEATTELAASHADGPTPREFELSLPTLVKARGATLLDALELHLPGSGEHADGTATYAFAAAVELGFEREHAEGIRETARLHEIGKVYVPASVVSSDPNELDPQSRALLDSHPSYGAELARGAAIPSQACDWIAATSERLTRLKMGSAPVYFENRYRCRDGSFRWLGWTAAPFPAESNGWNSIV